VSRFEGLEVDLLGGFAVRVDGRVVPATAFARRRARTLLKLLALQPGHRLHRDQVLDLLWPDLDLGAATAQLYKTVHQVRLALTSQEAEAPSGAEMLRLEDEVLGLSSARGLTVDVDVFESLAREALAVEPPDPGDVRRALAHYGGDLLPTDLYEEWTQRRRDALRETFLDLLRYLGDAHLGAGRSAEAADAYRQILKADPSREDAHRGLMRVFAAEGSVGRLARQLERCRGSLAQELGVGPSPETLALYETLRAAVEEGPPPGAGDGPFALDLPGHLPRLAGRSADIEAGKELLGALAAGRGSVLVIQGAPGIGKTRLAQEVAALARLRGYQVWVGAAHEHEPRGAYGPVVEALRSAMRGDRSMAELIPAELAALIPELPAPGPAVLATDRGAAKMELFAGVFRFVAARAATAPVVVVLEDLHAAGEESVALLHYLARQVPTVRLMIVATLRDGEPDAPTGLTAVLNSLEHEGVVRTISLSPLTPDEISDVAAQALGGGEIHPQVVGEIHRTCEGNPLFGAELARHMASAARLVRMEGVWQFREPVSEPVPVPASIRALVDARADALSPDGLRLLHSAAVIGRDVPLSWLGATFQPGNDQSESRLLDALDEVVARRLLEETGRGYRFPHGLIRLAIEQGLSPARRRALHGQVAERLEELFRGRSDAPVEALARHFAEAGRAIPAARYLLEAGDASGAVYAHEQALQRYEEAIALLEGAEPAPEEAGKLRSMAWERTGDVHRLVGHVSRSQAAYLAALEGRSSSDRLEIHRKVALASILAVDMATASEHLQAARDLLDADPVAEARWLIAQALYEWHLNHLEEAAATGKRALDLAEAAGAATEASQACEILALANFPLGNWEEGLRYELRRSSGDWSPEIAVAVDAHL
jgi:DNA-binding SARP family transcriptional activator